MPPPLAGLPAASCQLPWSSPLSNREAEIIGVLKVRSILSILYFKLFFIVETFKHKERDQFNGLHVPTTQLPLDLRVKRPHTHAPAPSVT